MSIDAPTVPFFPEPTAPDERVGFPGETTWHFLHRSTWSRAREIRAFYNTTLEALPAASHQPLLDGMRAGRDESVLLELLVGRFLQLRGAIELEHEPEAGGRRVDWRATFAGGLLHIEAFVPVYNAATGTTASRHQRLLDVLEGLVPYGWWLMAFHLPALPGDARLSPFRRVAEELLRQLPPAQTVDRDAVIHLQGRLPQGRVNFTAIRATGRGGLGGGAMLSHWDNSEQVLRNAWNDRRKRKQGRSVPPPALLAIAGSFLGADLEDFQNALFGRDLGEPDGAMVESNPPWAGVLAFPTVSPAGAPDPVLFVAPAYEGPLSAAVSRLEVRRLVRGGVKVQPADDTDVLAGIRWAQR